MASAVLYMSMSLDGFVAGPNNGPDNGLGDGGAACTSGFSRVPRTSTDGRPAPRESTAK